MSHTSSGGNTVVNAIIDIEALRQFRHMNLNSNWLKDLRTEIFKEMYTRPIHPKNLWMEQEPLKHSEVDKIYRQNIEKLVERGTWTKPFHEFEGSKYLPEGESDTTIDDIKGMWSNWDD